MPSAPEPDTALRFGFSGRSLRPEKRGTGTALGGGGSDRQGGRGTVHEQVVPTTGPTSPSPPALEERGQAEGRDRAEESKHVIIEIVLYMCQSEMTEVFLQDVLYTISLLKQATFNN